jgi:TPR repeat protein
VNLADSHWGQTNPPILKVNQLVFTLLLLLSAPVFQLPAQQVETDRKQVEEVKVKAEAGDADSEYRLGLFYYNGEGVAKDFSEAVKWYRKAAEKNLADAQDGLGFCYANGQGVAKDEVEAVKWYRKAAEQNYAPARNNLANSYANGQGVTKDQVEAVKWYRKAAEQNYARAQSNLAYSYANGHGVSKDEAEAVKWYRKAAEQNLAVAQNNLAYSYANGQGVAKDEVEAVKWYRKAAEQNYAYAQYNLGVCYEHGDGVAKDYVEGYKWSLLAAAQGDEAPKTRSAMRSQASARKAITMLENEMSQEQIAEGRKLAGNFKPREAEKLSDQEKEMFKANMEKVEKIPVRPTATSTPAATVPTQDMSPGTRVYEVDGDDCHIVSLPANDLLNLRSGPGQNYSTLTTVAVGEQGLAMDHAITQNGETSWVRVFRWDNGHETATFLGWANKRYLQFDR